jgi:hypothetical protein
MSRGGGARKKPCTEALPGLVGARGGRCGQLFVLFFVFLPAGGVGAWFA